MFRALFLNNISFSLGSHDEADAAEIKAESDAVHPPGVDNHDDLLAKFETESMLEQKVKPKPELDAPLVPQHPHQIVPEVKLVAESTQPISLPAKCIVSNESQNSSNNTRSVLSTPAKRVPTVLPSRDLTGVSAINSQRNTHFPITATISNSGQFRPPPPPRPPPPAPPPPPPPEPAVPPPPAASVGQVSMIQSVSIPVEYNTLEPHQAIPLNYVVPAAVPFTSEQPILYYSHVSPQQEQYFQTPHGPAYPQQATPPATAMPFKEELEEGEIK